MSTADLGVTPECEACGSSYLAWQLDPTCLLWRCPRCGHIRRDLALSRARARSAVYGGDPRADRLRLGLTYRRIRRVIPARKSLDVLELGSGEGALLERFARDGHRAVGVDPEARSVHGAQVHVGDFVEVADEQAWQARFDLVVAIHCLEHVDDLPQVLDRVGRALRPGGTFYALTPNASSEGLRLLGSAWWMLEDPTHRQFVSPGSARLLWAEAGLGEVRTRSVRLDSLSVEGASLARLRRTPHPEGVLSSRAARIATVAVLPLTVPARSMRPRLAPTLEIVASRHSGAPA